MDFTVVTMGKMPSNLPRMDFTVGSGDGNSQNEKNPFSEFQTSLCLPKKCRTILQHTDIKHVVSGRILKK